MSERKRERERERERERGSWMKHDPSSTQVRFKLGTSGRDAFLLPKHHRSCRSCPKNIEIRSLLAFSATVRLKSEFFLLRKNREKRKMQFIVKPHRSKSC